MKENEIQIGDFLRLRYEKNGEEIVTDFQVDQLVRNGEMLFVWSKKHGNMGRVSQIDPIPLTAEILEKNGFVYKDIPFSPEWELFGLTIYRGGGRFYLDYGANMSMEINSVHQLQHLLLLCGIIRDIVL